MLFYRRTQVKGVPCEYCAGCLESLEVFDKARAKNVGVRIDVALEAGWRIRCKIIRNLVRGESPSTIARILGCGRSQVYRVANRFVTDKVQGLIDRREDNGTPKVTEDFELHILIAVAGSPQEHGYQRPTWTQELLVQVMANLAIMFKQRVLYAFGHGQVTVGLGRPWRTSSCANNRHMVVVLMQIPVCLAMTCTSNSCVHVGRWYPYRSGQLQDS